MAKVVSCEQFLLRRVAAEQLRAAESMRDMVTAVEQFIEVVDQACAEARGELEQALARTNALQESGAAERRRSWEALENGGLEAMIAERDRLLAGRQSKG
ncbi:MAG: hypothetical protein NVV74_10940 [Magnetospirillum sp.]|nr:hypothetical protein [Magnetospirillum sp.]